MTLFKWSKTAADNATADSTINWAEGMAPSAVNDSGRAEMAAVAKYRDDTAGVETAGTSTAYTLTSNQGFTSLSVLDGQTVTIIPHTTSGASPTLNVDSLGAKALNSATGVAVSTGALIAGTPYQLTYFNASNEFIVNNVLAVAAAGTVATSSVADNAVTYAKMQDITATNRLIGRATTGAGDPEEITIGAGLQLSDTTLRSAFPPSGSFSNLSIKVASNTTVTISADYVTTTDGSTFQTTALSATCNLGSNGAVNRLDTGTIAVDTWYAIWAIAKADGTTGTLASTSFSNPTLPSGYSFKARIGAVQTVSGSATLYGTWQRNRRAQYIVGLAQTANLPFISLESVGNVSTPTYVLISMTRYLPLTATVLHGAVRQAGSSDFAIVAPNASYGNESSLTNPPPIARRNGAGTTTFSLVLETNGVYAAGNSSAGNLLLITGWEDSI